METSLLSLLEKKRGHSWYKVQLIKINLLLVSITLIGNVEAQQLSRESHVSLITLGPSPKELISAFGHSAIRVVDPVAGMDYFFNYGVFSFNQPNFYLNFARGQNMYQLGVYDYQSAKTYYSGENRSIHEQILNVTQSQKQRIFDYLSNNALPENKYYLYDYFYDNCATRPRDVLKAVLGDSIKFDNTPEKKSITIRGLTDIYLDQQPWGDLGIDICLGLPMDKMASRTEYMFLPDSLESGFDMAKIKSDSAWIPLVAEKKVVYQGNPDPPSFSPFHPWFVFGLISLGILGISLRDWRRKKITEWLDKIVFVITGALGVLLLLLWFATSHKAAANNLNILWAIPTNLVFPFISKARKRYFLFAAALTGGLLLCWFLLPQQLHVFLIPLVMSFGVRYWVNYKLL